MEKTTYVIAEVGINHNGDLALAKQMILAAKDCGANCVKFQTFKAEEFVSDSKQTYTYSSQGKEITESMLEMFKRYEFSKEEWIEIVSFCKENEIEFCSTAQNFSDLVFLNSICDLPFIKVGSDDLTNIELMKKYAKFGKRMIISAGMAYAFEIEDAVEAIRSVGNENITVLHCVSCYPTMPDEVNLKKIPAIREAFGIDVGYSDHTIGSSAAVGAVCFGATIIEKHFTLDKDMPGPDHWFASDVADLRQYVLDIRSIEKAIGSSILKPTKKEMGMRDLARRKIVASRDIEIGHIISQSDLTFKRADGEGLAPKDIDFIIGRKLKAGLLKNDLITLNNLD